MAILSAHRNLMRVLNEQEPHSLRHVSVRNQLFVQKIIKYLPTQETARTLMCVSRKMHFNLIENPYSSSFEQDPFYLSQYSLFRAPKRIVFSGPLTSYLIGQKSYHTIDVQELEGSETYKSRRETFEHLSEASFKRLERWREQYYEYATRWGENPSPKEAQVLEKIAKIFEARQAILEDLRRIKTQMEAHLHEYQEVGMSDYDMENAPEFECLETTKIPPFSRDLPRIEIIKMTGKGLYEFMDLLESKEFAGNRQDVNGFRYETSLEGLVTRIEVYFDSSCSSVDYLERKNYDQYEDETVLMNFQTYPNLEYLSVEKDRPFPYILVPTSGRLKEFRYIVDVLEREDIICLVENVERAPQATIVIVLRVGENYRTQYDLLQEHGLIGKVRLVLFSIEMDRVLSQAKEHRKEKLLEEYGEQGVEREEYRAYGLLDTIEKDLYANPDGTYEYVAGMTTYTTKQPIPQPEFEDN